VAVAALIHLLFVRSFLPHPFGQWYTGNAHLLRGKQPMSGGQLGVCQGLPLLVSPQKGDRVPLDGDLACKPRSASLPVFL